jgi:cytosine/uracil/thiamine/allantoin permease
MFFGFLLSDVLNLDLAQILTVTVRSLISFSSLLLENDNLVAFEVLQHVTMRLFWAVASGRVEEGEKVVYYFNSTAGMVMIVGFAVLAISVVFQYGVELQQLSDETL